MGVIVTNMEMPEDCDTCPFFDDDGDYPFCKATSLSKGYNWSPVGQRMMECPLCEITIDTTKQPDRTKLLEEKIGLLLTAIAKAQDALNIVRRI